MSTTQVELPGGQKKDSEEILGPWKKRKLAALKARKPFEGQWLVNQAFAAGNQWVEYSPRDHRAINLEPLRRQMNRSAAKADVLTQYLWTAVGKFAKDDFRPQLLFQHDDAEGEDYAEGANKAFGWGWDEEWDGDDVLLNLLLTLVTFGTGAVRCRYDRNRGPLIGELPHVDGKPITDLEAARKHMAEAKYYGENIDLRAVREGAVVWELLSPWNLLPPPAVESERDFPWHLIVRPVHLDELRTLYGDKVAEVTSDELDAMNILGLRDVASNRDANTGFPTGGDAKLEDHALVYTGYEQPCVDYPRGATAVFTQDGHLLDFADELDYNEPPHGPRSGLTYFHYWKVKQRFFGRALIEAGIGPQRILNKRESQNDEIIDRALPKVYEEEGAIVDVPTGLAMERVQLRPGASKPLLDAGLGPGPWMSQSRQDQLDNIERALGLHGVSLGESASASAPYARIALESENDSDKLDPIAKDFKLGVADLSRDSLEAMRNWPQGKLLLIAGDEDRLEALTFQQSTIPAPFMVKPPKGSSIPRSQGAELQKVNDLWDAALASGAVAANPVAWLDWYKTSLDNGKAEDLPTLSLMQQQRHKAALENVVMARTGQPLPVAPYDDAKIHVEEHTADIERLSETAMSGDQPSTIAIQAIDAHRQMHLAQEAQMAAQSAAQLPPPPGPQLPPGPQGAGPPAPPTPPPTGP